MVMVMAIVIILEDTQDTYKEERQTISPFLSTQYILSYE